MSNPQDEREAQLAEAIQVIRGILKFIRTHAQDTKGFDPELAEKRVNARLDQIAALANQRAEAVPDIPKELDVRTILLDVVPGWDGMGEEVFAKTVADVEKKLGAMGEELEDWQLGIRRYQPEAVPQGGQWREVVQQARDCVYAAQWDSEVVKRLDALLATPQPPAAPPYLTIYEWVTPHGVHRSFSPANWNGWGPTREVQLYRKEDQ